MLLLPWLYLALLSIGYVLALAYGQLGVLALVSVALLLIAGYAVRQQRTPWARYLGHGLFIVLASKPAEGDCARGRNRRVTS